MKEKPKTYTDLDILREKAEKIQKEKPTLSNQPQTESDVQKLLNELNIYKIMLKIQNDELKSAIERETNLTTKQYTALYDFAPSAFFTLSKKGEIIAMNLIAANMLGIERSALNGHLFSSLVSHDSLEIFNHFLLDVFKSHTNKTCEVLLNDNSALPKYAHLAGIVNQNGEYCLVNMIDNSGSKQVEGTLRRNEERLRTITEHAPNIILEVNKSGQILYINRIYNSFKLEDIIGKNILDFTPFEYHDVTNMALNSAFSKGLHQSFKSRGLGQNGEMKWYQCNVAPVIVSGEIKNAIVYINDITELVRTEERRISILNTAMDGFGLLNIKGDLLEVNETYCQMVGYNKHELMSMQFSELVVNELVQEPNKHLQRVMEMGEDRFEIQHRTKSGILLDIEVSMQYQPIDSGHFVTFLHDITERKQIEKAIKDNEQKFRNYVDFAPHGIFVANEFGEYIDINPAAATITGFSKNELLSMNLRELVPEDSIDYALNHFSRVTNTGFASGQFAFIRKDRSIGYWSVDSVKLSDKSFLGFAVDLTEHKVAVEALRQNEILLKSVMELLPVGIWILDETGRIVSGNAAGLDIWGGVKFIGIEDFHEYKGWMVSTGKLIEPHEWSSSRAIQKGESSFDEEIEIECFDGTHKIILSSTVPLRNSDGSISGAIVTNQDITERKKAEKSILQLNEELENRVSERTSELLKVNAHLQQAESKYRTVADHTYGWEFWTDQEGNFLYCSPSCERITGYKVSEFLKNPGLLNKIIHPDDLKHFHCHKQKEDKRLDGNMEINYRIVKPDGDIRWIGHVCQPIFDEKGNYIGNRGSNRDITERKKMEDLLKTSNQKYKLVSENITDGIFICRNGYFEYANKAMSHIFGSKGNELIGMKLSQLFTPEYTDKLEIFDPANTTSDLVQSLEIECFVKDKSTIFVEFLFNYNAAENVIYGVVHDITEKKQIQENIIKAIIQTEEKERAHFSKELHDGLGPLLSTIKLYMQWSQRAKTNLSREEIFCKAEAILEDALITVKEISNKLSPHLLANHGLSSAIQSFVSKLEESSNIRINFISNVERRLGDEIEAAIYRAVIECLNNTIKHARASNISIRIYEDDNQLLLNYKDDGRGFDLDATLSIKKGLGLFNLQNRIQTIGGKISMVSKPGQGVDYQISVVI